MIAIVAIEAVAILVLTVLVSGLLRSHAEILRGLHSLGVNLDPDAEPIHAPPVLTVGRPGQALAAKASDVTGLSPHGEAVRVGVDGARRDTLIAFLSSGCSTCATFWQVFADGSYHPVPGDARLVVVTHDPGAEVLSRIRELAPPGVTTVMSSAAWEAYAVPVAPYFAYVSGPSGRVTGEGAARSWQQVRSLMATALSEGAAAAGAATNADRAARADSDLMAAGLLPGDPRLFPRPADEESR